MHLCCPHCHLFDRLEIEMFQMRNHIQRPVIHFSEHPKSNIAPICQGVIPKPPDVGKEGFSIVSTEFQILAFAYIFVEHQATSLSGDNRRLCHSLEFESTVISTVYDKAHLHRNPLSGAFWGHFGRFEHS